MKSAVIIYWSKTGNTEKVAVAIKEGLEAAGVYTNIKRCEEAENAEFFDYDLVCLGSPAYEFHLPKPMANYIKTKLIDYRKRGFIKIGAPKVPGKSALVFCTYSGPHTGINEATTTGKYISQFFEHIGFSVIDEWYVLSEFHGSLENSTKVGMGDIRGKPTKEDLQKIKEEAKRVASSL
jgi:flavodoxin